PDPKQCGSALKQRGGGVCVRVGATTTRRPRRCYKDAGARPMHSCNTRFTILSLLSYLVAGGLGCSGGADPDISVATAALYPGAAVSLTDSEACIVTTTT